MLFLTFLTLSMFCISLHIRNKLILLYSSILLSLSGMLLIAVLFPYYVVFVVYLWSEEIISQISPYTLSIGQIFYVGCIALITIWQGMNMIEGKNSVKENKINE